jgi:hypothetical protein
VQSYIVQSPRGCVVFDDSVLNKEHSHTIELVRLQYSGNEHGLVNCLYVNPDTGQYWIVDYRIFNPEGDGKRKLDHVQQMLTLAIADKALSFTHVLFDSWYATKDMMLFAESMGRFYYCPLKSNRNKRVPCAGRLSIFTVNSSK